MNENFLSNYLKVINFVTKYHLISWIGSAMAGSIGGNNAHAANIVTAIYIATGQVCLWFSMSYVVAEI